MKARGQSFVKGTQVIQALEEVLRCVSHVQKCRVERARISADEHVRVEEIRAKRDIILEYLERSFDERRVNFGRLFSLLDEAVARGDHATITGTLSAVVELSRSSPFKDLADVERTRGRLASKAEWRF